MVTGVSRDWLWVLSEKFCLGDCERCRFYGRVFGEVGEKCDNIYALKSLFVWTRFCRYQLVAYVVYGKRRQSSFFFTLK